MRKRSLIYLITVILVILLGYLAYEYLFIGKVTITTGNPNATISISKIGSTSPIKQSSSKLVVKLHKGDYIATVQGNSLGASQIVKVIPHKNQGLVINPEPPKGVEPVIDNAGSAISAAGSQLFFVNSQNNYLYRVDRQNNVSLLDPTDQFTDIKTGSANFVVAQDNGGHLFNVGGSGDSKLPINLKVGLFSLAPDGTLYFTSGKDVYKWSDGKAMKIYSSDSTFSGLAASNYGVSLINSPSSDTVKSGAAYVLFIDTGGRTTKADLASGPIAWSPNGQYAALSFGTSSAVYDKGWHKVADLPNIRLSNQDWLNNKTLVYSIDDQLWQFDMDTQKSFLMANMPLGATIVSTTVNTDGSYLYLGLSDNSTGEVIIKRIGLKSQEVDKQLYELQSILPQNQNGCAMSLVNFSGPSVQYSPSGDICRGQVVTNLQSLGIDTSKLEIKPSP